MTPSRSEDDGGSDKDLTAAIEEASRSLGVPYRPPGEIAPASGPPAWRRRFWIVTVLLVAGIAAAWTLRGTALRQQPAHLVESDLRWAVARVVEHVEAERTLRGRLPAEGELRVLLGETLDYSVRDGGYRIVGRRDGVRVEYDGSVPLDEWRSRVLHPPESPSP